MLGTKFWSKRQSLLLKAAPGLLNQLSMSFLMRQALIIKWQWQHLMVLDSKESVIANFVHYIWQPECKVEKMLSTEPRGLKLHTDLKMINPLSIYHYVDCLKIVDPDRRLFDRRVAQYDEWTQGST